MALSGLDGAITLWAVTGGDTGSAISAVIFLWPTSSMTTPSMLRLCLCGLGRLPHFLGGEAGGLRECYVGVYFLLAYNLDDNAKHASVVFVRTGTHADLFE